MKPSLPGCVTGRLSASSSSKCPYCGPKDEVALDGLDHPDASTRLRGAGHGSPAQRQGELAGLCVDALAEMLDEGVFLGTRDVLLQEKAHRVACRAAGEHLQAGGAGHGA